MNTPTLPTIHSNGTGKQTLLDGYLDAVRAISQADYQLRRVDDRPPVETSIIHKNIFAT